MPKTYNDLFLETRKLFRENGIESYNLEARIIVSQAAGKSMEKFMQGLRLYTTDEMARTVEQLRERRLKGEPVAYLTGRWEFFGLPVEVTTDVLIPRTDTEVLAGYAIEFLSARKMDARVLDLCSGSGCIGCAVAHALPAARVVMVDNSREALNVGRRNVSLNNLGTRITCIEADVREAPPMLVGSFDLLISNPPYIPSTDILGLDASVRDYEPLAALDGGADGLDYYRAILKNWKVVIREGGAIMFELGIGQANEVANLMRQTGFRNIECIKDTAGIDRVIMGLF